METDGMITLTFTLYGMTQAAYGSRTLTLELPEQITVRDAQAKLLELIPLDGQAIALATQTRVLKPDDKLPLHEELAVLPPVCGG
jgi:molybdopterin converting factor small subunit